MIYLDNAATSRTKPEVVLDAYMHYVREIGANPGRGSYSLGIQASRMLYQSRKTVASFFGLGEKSNVVFTKNSTEAINLFLNGFLCAGDHVLISCYEHNAVLRPLHTLKQKGIIDYTVLPETVLDDPENELMNYIKPNTKLAAVTLASNLTGQFVYTRVFGEVCKSKEIAVFVDASQGAGKGHIDMLRDNIDFLAFTGHKDLLAMPGVGGLCSQQPITFSPLIQGGTGIHGEYYSNPAIYPDAYESGTLNMPAIWSLKASIDYLFSNLEKNNQHEENLTQRLVSGMLMLDNVITYKTDRKRVPTVCFNVKGYSSSDVVSALDKSGICVRGGIHCAILAHETLGTVQTGAVRVSLNFMNTEADIDSFLDVIGGLR